MQTTTDAAQLFDSEVLDSAGNKIGSVDSVWADDATGEPEFIGVKTGWLFGKNHVIPLANAQMGNGTITIPYQSDQIKDAPAAAAGDEISPDQESEIYSYYGVERSTAPSPTGLPAGGEGTQYSPDATQDSTTTGQATGGESSQADMTLSEEELQVGKRQVEAGRVRLRKVVRTEHREVPVELRREDVEIERVPASEAGAPSDAFQEGEVEVPIMREEPVVAKEAHVVGGVRLTKDVDTQTQTVGGDVRTEDVEVDDDTDTETTPTDRPY